jgi:hypothetical protein
MSVSKLVRLPGIPFAALVVVLTMFGAWPWSGGGEQTIDTDDAAARLSAGLNGLSDADGRKTGEGQYVSPDMSLADAQLAYAIRLAVDPKEAEAVQESRGWWR